MHSVAPDLRIDNRLTQQDSKLQILRVALHAFEDRDTDLSADVTSETHSKRCKLLPGGGGGDRDDDPPPEPSLVSEESILSEERDPWSEIDELAETIRRTVVSGQSNQLFQTLSSLVRSIQTRPVSNVLDDADMPLLPHLLLLFTRLAPPLRRLIGDDLGRSKNRSSGRPQDAGAQETHGLSASVPLRVRVAACCAVRVICESASHCFAVVDRTHEKHPSLPTNTRLSVRLLLRCLLAAHRSALSRLSAASQSALASLLQLTDWVCCSLARSYPDSSSTEGLLAVFRRFVASKILSFFFFTAKYGSGQPALRLCALKYLSQHVLQNSNPSFVRPRCLQFASIWDILTASKRSVFVFNLKRLENELLAKVQKQREVSDIDESILQHCSALLRLEADAGLLVSSTEARTDDGANAVDDGVCDDSESVPNSQPPKPITDYSTDGFIEEKETHVELEIDMAASKDDNERLSTAAVNRWKESKLVKVLKTQLQQSEMRNHEMKEGIRRMADSIRALRLRNSRNETFVRQQKKKEDNMRRRLVQREQQLRSKERKHSDWLTCAVK